MFAVATTRPETPHEPVQQIHVHRHKKYPPWPPQRIYAAMNYVSECQGAMRPFCKERSSQNSVLEASEYENELIERNLNPLQRQSYKAACDLLEAYFSGENWQAPVGYREVVPVEETEEE
jgi:hypothetical protein